MITGCSSGLGRSMALAALRAGDRVLATARDVRGLEGLITAFPETCETAALDVTDRDQCAAVLASMERDGVDFLVNNAGGAVLGALEEQTEAEAAEQMELNYFAPLRLAAAVLPGMRARGAGHLVFVSAAAAVGNYPGFAHYGAAKAALEAACESLRAEVLPHGISVTLVQPGPFRTMFAAKSVRQVSGRIADYSKTSGAFAQLLARIDGRQPGDPDKAAALVVATLRAGHAPFRLPLGRYMIRKLRDRSAVMLQDAVAHEASAGATEFGGQ